jgi:ParB-like chromosome segregation protein Spo0J
MNAEFHPLAQLFPMMDETELGELADSIRERGIMAAIVTLEGKILDGRNRYLACKMAGVEPRVREYVGNDPLGYVVAANLTRRHLTTSQRAAIAVKLVELTKKARAKRASQEKSAVGKKVSNDTVCNSNKINAPQGGVGHTGVGHVDGVVSPDIPAISIEKAGEMFGVSRVSVARAARVLKNADPETRAAVEQGEKTLAQVGREESKPPNCDALGHEIPDAIRAEWNRADEFARTTITALTKIKTEIERGLESHDVIFAEVMAPITATIADVRTQVGTIKPYTLCPRCRALQRERCKLCGKRGWISRWRFEHALPEAERKMWATPPADK